MALVYNASTHYTAGKSSAWSLVILSFVELWSLGVSLDAFLYLGLNNTYTFFGLVTK